MSHVEEKAKQWRVTLVDFLALTAGVSLSLAIMRMSVTLHFARPHTDTAFFLLGIAVLPATIGAFLGKLFTGNYRGAWVGACYGWYALLAFVLFSGRVT